LGGDPIGMHSSKKKVGKKFEKKFRKKVQKKVRKIIILRSTSITRCGTSPGGSLSGFGAIQSACTVGFKTSGHKNSHCAILPAVIGKIILKMIEDQIKIIVSKVIEDRIKITPF
jgi:hypothetical protein